MTGAAGMLGHKVCDVARDLGHDVIAADLAEFDLTDADATTAFVAAAAPAAVINCAAYTNVDAAEADEALAHRVNADGAGNVARAAAAVGARVVHVSTDYVFDGDNARPWVESDPTSPLGAYGRTKLAGEQQLAAATPDHAIVRTAWLFGVGGPNFVDTMLKLGAERDEVSVVVDQVGCPTWTGHLAPALVDLAARPELTGVFHGAGGGQCSWHELAAEAMTRAGVDCVVHETTSDKFPRPAPRPAWSVMATERTPGITLAAWQDGLDGHLAERGRA